MNSGIRINKAPYQAAKYQTVERSGRNVLPNMSKKAPVVNVPSLKRTFSINNLSRRFNSFMGTNAANVKISQTLGNNNFSKNNDIKPVKVGKILNDNEKILLSENRRQMNRDQNIIQSEKEHQIRIYRYLLEEIKLFLLKKKKLQVTDQEIINRFGRDILKELKNNQFSTQSSLDIQYNGLLRGLNNEKITNLQNVRNSIRRASDLEIANDLLEEYRTEHLSLISELDIKNISRLEKGTNIFKKLEIDIFTYKLDGVYPGIPPTNYLFQANNIGNASNMTDSNVISWLKSLPNAVDPLRDNNRYSNIFRYYLDFLKYGIGVYGEREINHLFYRDLLLEIENELDLEKVPPNKIEFLKILIRDYIVLTR